MQTTEFEKTAAPTELAPAELNEGDLTQVNAGALPPLRAPKQPADTDLIGLL